MFSAKNYGLPKDLIEAAKKVHEKQLEEDSHGKMPSKEHVMKMLKDGMSETEMMKMHSDVDKDELKKLVKDCKEEMNEELFTAKKVHEKQLEENLDKSIKKPKNKDPDFTGLSKALDPTFKKIEKQRKKDLKFEEVQFTEEELAEAFAIFLEENFHVEMLTEEDLDYVFENEFPQWLEEGLGRAIRRGIGYLVNLNNKIADATYPAAQKAVDVTKKGATAVGNAVTNVGRKVGVAARQNPVSTAVTGGVAGALGATAVNRDTGSDKNRNNELPKDADESDVPYADSDEEQKKTPEKAIRKSIAKAKEEVKKEEAKKQASQAKPTSTARKQVKRSAPKPQSFGALLRKVGGNAPATTATAAGRRKVALLDARARARTAARDAIVRKTGRGQLSWAKKAFNSDN